MLKKVRNPVLFQGKTDKRNYFEGWYYKQVSDDEKCVIGFIPGVSIQNDDPHSFIQYIFLKMEDNGEHVVKTGYCRFPIEAFKYTNNPFSVVIGENTFSETKISISMTDGSEEISVVFEFGGFTPIKTSLLTPNIMGVFAFLPNMECYHGVISMKHRVDGEIIFSGEKISFINGTGYIEKDWGTSFPKEYIWIQCNHFNNSSASMIMSIAKIPFMGFSFKGFLGNVVLDDKEYRFATYNGSKLSIVKRTEDFVKIVMENRKARVEIEAAIEQSGELIAPYKGKMHVRIKEELSGVIKLSLFDKKTGKRTTDSGRIAGIEIVK